MIAPSKKPNNSRALAAQVIAQVIRQQGSLSSLLPDALLRASDKDTALLQELCYGTLRHHYSLKEQIDKYLSKPLKEKDSDLLALLLVGAYQIIHMRIPAYAAINSTVEATRSLKKKWAKGLVNAVLRKVLSKKESSGSTNHTNEHPEHPAWLIKNLEDSYGKEKAKEIFSANNGRAPMTLRVNQQKISRDDYLEKLTQQNIEAVATKLSVDGIQLNKPTDIKNLPDFDKGECSVQDESPQLCAQLLLGEKISIVQGSSQESQKPLHILDACAAPGGKTCHLLEVSSNTHITAIEIDPKRAERITENLNRLDLTQNTIKVLTADASEPNSWFSAHCNNQLFDRILLDAPCSATGVIRRHPDIKLLRRKEDIPALAKLQLQLLEALWLLLKPEGILLYATCSVLPAENDEVVERFIHKTQDAVVSEINTDWGLVTEHGKQLLPRINGHDGFYFSLIKKK